MSDCFYAIGNYDLDGIVSHKENKQTFPKTNE